MHLSNDKEYNASAHRTVMKCFKPILDWDNFEVDHINNDSFDNRLCNLQWVSHEHNEQLRFMKESIRFSNEQVHAICNAFANKMNPMEICYYILHIKYIGSVHAKLMDIYRGKTYREIRNQYTF